MSQMTAGYSFNHNPEFVDPNSYAEQQRRKKQAQEAAAAQTIDKIDTQALDSINQIAEEGYYKDAQLQNKKSPITNNERDEIEAIAKDYGITGNVMKSIREGVNQSQNLGLSEKQKRQADLENVYNLSPEAIQEAVAPKTTVGYDDEYERVS